MKEYAGKKILIIVENLPLPFDRRVWQEAKALRDKGAEVFIICPRTKAYNKRYEEINGIKIYRHKILKEAGGKWEYFIEYPTALISEFFLALWIYFKHGFDVIHACNPPDLICLVALPFKLLGKKFVFDHHDVNPELYKAKFNRKDIFYKLVCLMEKLTFACADMSIATNNSYKKVAIDRGRMKPEEVFVVRSGPDLKRIRKKTVNNKYKNGREYLVGYVGVIGKQEGLNYLIDAVKYIIDDKSREDIQFICVGSGPDLGNIVDYCKEKGVSEYITFTGRLPDEDLMEILSSSDICVNPDEYNEMNDKSTMNKIMEYMALGTPIVQFDMTEGRFSAKGSSLYAKPNDAQDFAEKILELINNPEKRKKMGEKAIKRVKNKLVWEKEKQNLYEAYEFLLK